MLFVQLRIAVVLELVVVVMIALAEGQERDDAAVAGAVVGRVGTTADACGRAS
jgi:hypothetical protein